MEGVQVVLAGDGGEFVLVGGAAPLRERRGLTQGLLATTDADENVDIPEEGLALVAPVEPLVVDDTLVDVEAVVLLGLSAGDAGRVPTPLLRDAIGEGRFIDI